MSNAALLSVDVDLDWLTTYDSEPLVLPLWPESQVMVLVVVERMPDQALRGLIVPTKDLMEAVLEHSHTGIHQLWFTVPRAAAEKRFALEL